MKRLSLSLTVAAHCCVALVMTTAFAQDDRKIPRLLDVPVSLPQDGQVRLNETKQKLELRFAAFKKSADAFKAKKAIEQSDDEYKALNQERSRYIDAATDFNKSVATAVADSNQGTVQAAEIVRGIRAIQVPPPILAEDASIGIGELAPEDHTTRNVLLGLDSGVAALEVFATIGGKTVPAVKVILAAGKTVIAAENAADVYLVKQNDVYEQALRWLKDGAKRGEFTAIVRALKENKPVSENASIEMVRTAQAMLDPKLGNSGMRIAWDAMFSPEARRAAFTQACIELGGELIGQGAGKVFTSIQARHNPAFREAKEYLSKAKVALERTTDPAAKESLKEAIKQANGMIANTYRTIHVPAKAVENIQSIFSKRVEEEHREQRKEK